MDGWGRGETAGRRHDRPDRGRTGSVTRPGGRQEPNRAGSVVLVVEPGQKAGQPVNGDVESGGEVDEIAQPLGEPGHRDLFRAAPLLEFLEAAFVKLHQLPGGWPS